jgi:hypothetical protein
LWSAFLGFVSALSRGCAPWSSICLAVLLATFFGSLIPLYQLTLWQGPSLYAEQTRAFASGRLGLDVAHYDTAAVGGLNHVVNPPFPSVVLLPFVVWLPQEADRLLSVAVSLALTCLGCWALLRILRLLGVKESVARWLCLGLFAGTGYWCCLAMAHAMWFFAHVVAITFLLLAIYEAMHRGRGLLVGLALGAAFLSRQIMVYSAVFLAVLLWERHRQKVIGNSQEHPLALPTPPLVAGERVIRNGPWTQLALFCLGAGIMGAGYLWFNWARFGDPFDTGYNLLRQTDFLGWRQKHLGLFHVMYIPVNLIHLLFQGPHIEFTGAGLLKGWHMNKFGTSITFASPFLFLAFLGRWPVPLVHKALVASIVLTLTHALMYHTNGWVQVNTYRYALDFVPLLVLLAALGATRVQEKWLKWTVIYSVVLNALAMFWVPFVGRAYDLYLEQVMK